MPHWRQRFYEKAYVPFFEHTPKQIPHCLIGLLVERQFTEGNRGVSYGVTEAPKNSWQRHIRQETVGGFVEIVIQNFNCTPRFLVKFRNVSGHTVQSRLKPLWSHLHWYHTSCSITMKAMGSKLPNISLASTANQTKNYPSAVIFGVLRKPSHIPNMAATNLH